MSLSNRDAVVVGLLVDPVLGFLLSNRNRKMAQVEENKMTPSDSGSRIGVLWGTRVVNPLTTYYGHLHFEPYTVKMGKKK